MHRRARGSTTRWLLEPRRVRWRACCGCAAVCLSCLFPACLPVCLSICLSGRLSLFFFSLSLCLSVCLPVCLSVYLSVCPSVCPSFWLSVYLSGCLSVCLSVYLCVHPDALVGWDFSSRWLADGQTLATIRTSTIVPVDLNAVMVRVERNIAWLCTQGLPLSVHVGFFFELIPTSCVSKSTTP